MSAPLALWLDPESPLSSAQAAVLNETGWAFLGIDTLDGVVAHAPHADALVLRLSGDCSRLKAVQQLLSDARLNTPIICRVERQAMELAVEAAQTGALTVIATDDLREQPWLDLQLKLVQPSLPASTPIRRVVFVDPISQHLLALAQKVAQADVTALLVGPTGAGKEVLARVLHDASARARAPFVALNCAAIPDNLIEDMLFGHEKGAFTGAHREHKGVFEQANGGTLFLDEIGEMPMHLQSKLLRVLQEKQLTRLGGQTTVALNVRFVAATNKDLRRAIVDKEFREDLYYRIATFRLTLQPLRERPGDILPLAMQCLAQHSTGQRLWQIHPQAQAMLVQYPWPGNVRELENVMRRAMVLCPDHVLHPAHLMFDEALPFAPPAPLGAAPVQSVAEDLSAPAAPLVTGLPQEAWMQALPPTSAPSMATAPFMPAANPPAGAESATSTLPADLHSANRMNEHQVIMATLASTANKTEAAKRLGISPRTLRYKLAQLREMGLGLAVAG